MVLLDIGRLVFNGVRFRYSARSALVFDDFSWDLPQGKTVLLGPNGSGKSTMLGLAAGVLKPQAGRVGIRNPAGELTAVRAGTGWMPQSVRATRGLTVVDQVAYAG